MIPLNLSSFLASMSDGRQFDARINLWSFNLDVYPGCKSVYAMHDGEVIA